jgi:hypothetical protein
MGGIGYGVPAIGGINYDSSGMFIGRRFITRMIPARNNTGANPTIFEFTATTPAL